jgi:hypothetical protein
LHAHRCKHGLMTCPVHVTVQFLYRLINLWRTALPPRCQTPRCWTSHCQPPLPVPAPRCRLRMSDPALLRLACCVEGGLLMHRTLLLSEPGVWAPPDYPPCSPLALLCWTLQMALFKSILVRVFVCCVWRRRRINEPPPLVGVPILPIYQGGAFR